MDTDWAVHLLRGGPPEVVEQVRCRQPQGIAVSVVTAAELYVGVARARDPQAAEEAVQRLLTAFPVLAFEASFAPVFGRVQGGLRQQGIEIGDFDAAIAATCLSHDLTLLTNNLRHFRHVQGLKVVSAAETT